MRCVAVVCLLIALAPLCAANVMGIDLGSEYVKITSPHGNASIDIVLNEQTRRKSHNFIGFRGDDRFFGEDAKNLAARFPDNMFSMPNKLIGVEFNSQQKREFNDLLHTFALKSNEHRDTVNYSCRGDPLCEYSAEEILAMYLQYCKSITAKDAKIKPQDAVITIPADWTMGQRQALIDAAALVDIKVLALMHSTTATALQFGMQRRGFGNDTVNVVIFDMGATKTEVGVYRFTPPVEPKDGKRLKLAVSMGHMETLHIEVDPSLGGRTLDVCIARFLEDAIVEKFKIPRIIGGDSIQQHKAQFSLMRAANNVKETLSANAITPVTVEGVAPDKDFTGKVTREEFEEKCAGQFERVNQIAQKAITASGLKVEDITNFELMGGGVRPPRIVNELSKFLGRTVDRTLNSDESAAFGAGYYGARLSGYFRVRSFSVSDYLPNDIYFELVGADGKRSAKRPLFEHAAFGSRRSITVNRTADFVVSLFSTTDGQSFAPLLDVNVSGVTAALESLNYFDPNIVHENHTHIVRLELRLTDTGLIVVEDTEVRVRYAANVTKKVKVPRSEPTDANATEITNSSDDEAAPEQTHITVTEIQMKRRSTTLTSSTTFRNPAPMASQEILASKSVIAALEKKDKIKRDTATSKNNLETYIQWIRMEGILENAEVESLMNSSMRSMIEETTNEVKEWYEDGEGSYDSCTKLQYDEKLALLKNATSDVRRKLQEVEAAKKPKPEKKREAKDTKTKTKKDAHPESEPEESDSADAQSEANDVPSEDL